MMDAPHILVVDDDDRLRDLLGRYLRAQGLAVSAAADAKAARALLGLFQFDLLVLDVMMPGEDGISLASSLRKNKVGLPILMLSARAETQDRVAGLEAGVDDYLTKPFEPKELVLRIQAILRRSAAAAPAAKSPIVFGDYRFMPETMELQQDTRPVRLTASEGALLKALAECVGEPVSRETLALQLGQTGSERSVDVHIARLRRKIPPAKDRPPHIQTVRGAGYVLYGSRI